MTAGRLAAISGLALGAGVTAFALFDSTGWRLLAALLAAIATPFFLATASVWLARKVLWRVSTRLLASYVLIGVVPVGMVLALAYVVTLMLAGQLAGRRLEQELDRREQRLELAATTLARALESGSDAGTVAETIRTETANTLPGLGWAVKRQDGRIEGQAPVPLDGLFPTWADGAAAVDLVRFEDDGPHFFVARQYSAVGSVVLILPFEPAFHRSLESQLEIVIRFETGKKKNDGTGISAEGDPDRPEDLSHLPAASGPIRGRWAWWIHILDHHDVDWGSGETRSSSWLVAIVRSSIANELGAAFNVVDWQRALAEEDERQMLGAIATVVIFVLACLVGLAYFAAAVVAAILVIRIARATSRLGEGLAAIEAGQFDHRVQLGGDDQLSRLIDGFNRMATNLGTAVHARAEREALEHELTLARELQERLLPPKDFAFAGLEIAADFAPAAAIGGDFYDFVPESADRLAVVVADVSGHGLPTGIVMASAKASLAALAGTGADSSTILATLDREILRTTSRRTFVTLAHARFDLTRRIVELTNAGHLYPYRVQADGTLTALENPSRPLGVGLPATFITVSASFTAEDLWVMLSDGILEAANAAGEQFGFERLEAVLRATAGETAPAARDRILAAWQDFCGRDVPEDDRTLVVVRILAAN